MTEVDRQATQQDRGDLDRVYERFQMIVNGPALFNAVITALELDLFGYLSDHPGARFDDIQAFTGLHPHKLRVLMLGLCATELVVRDDDGYSNHAVAEELLAPDEPASWRHILRSWHRIYYPAFYHMTPALRSGTNATIDTLPGDEPTLYQRLGHDPELKNTFHTAMAAFTLQTMDGLLNNPEIASVRHLLDVGGGNGTVAAHLVARYPGTTVTVLDLPHVVELARQALEPSSTGIQLCAGDMFADEFPVGADAVLFSHVLDTVSAERAMVLLSKAFALIPDGGRIFIYGFNAADDERGGMLAARLSLYLNILATGDGMAWPIREFVTWLTQVGCVDIRTFPGLPYEHGLVVGRKAKPGPGSGS